jgi:beta-galactosidase
MNCLKQKITLLCAITLGVSQLLCAGQTPTNAGRLEMRLNDAWRFERVENQTNIFQPEPPEAVVAFNDTKWEKVFLPHTPRIEQPEQAQNYFQGVCWYRRHIAPDAAWRGKKVSLQFEGAMQVADVWVNGRHALTHRGGYLPFSVDLTGALFEPGGVVMAVRLDNADAPTIPPGKKHGQLDFCYFGGLYRNVKLVVTDSLHITDAVAANRIAAGGILVRTESASADSATIFAQADVLNAGSGETNVSVRFTAFAPGGEKVAEAEIKFCSFPPGDEVATNCLLTVTGPKLWHPDHPWLYTLKTEILRGEKVTDSVSTRFGIRTLACDDKHGFVINGEPLTIRGANRHQDFPWLGNAVPDNAQFRDLKRLKDAGFNFLRLAHYPQSPAVMDACDELGLMVSVCTPGWQYFNRSETFTNLAKQNSREMVRWHRNHACAIMWEVSLNETYGHDAFYAECARIAHEEYPGDQLLTSGDSYASKDVHHYDFPYAGWTDFYNRPAAPGFEGTKRSFAREYGDYEFGGEHSTTRVPRGAGENALLLQAWNFAWSHNRNASYPWLCGDCIWVGMDHFRGCSLENPSSRCGVLDYLRLPKFSYCFFQSQRDANMPAIFIANYWTPRPSPAKVVVFSNCEEVELFLNGKSLGRHKPDSGPDSDYGVWHPEADPVYMASGKTVLDDEKMTASEIKKPHVNALRAMFDGGNCQHIDHPPFIFAPVDYAPGELKAVGYIRGKPVAENVRRTPGKPAKLKLEAALGNRPLAADGVDAVFIHATVCDADGNPVPDATNSVKFKVSGKAQFVSPSATRAEAGVATVLIRSSDLAPGKVSLRASAPGLKSAQVELNATRLGIF